MKIWLDDNHTGYKPAPPGWIHVHNFAELTELLDSNQEPIEIMSFDNDLGPEPELTGYNIIKWFEKERLNRYPEKVVVHSENIVDAENIRCYDRNVRKHILHEE